MIRAIDLLKLPSLKEGYIAAGGGGVYNIIRRFEILEETYPSVVRFLDEGIFYVTTFWSLANDKESRLHLIEEMIKHHCAGIGIMPEVYLNNEIEPEILKLANDNNFPIFYIPSSVRWGDLLAEYSVISNNSIEAKERSWIDMALGIFVDFHISHDPGTLCKRMSEILHLPVVISAVTVYSYGTEGINVAVLISRIQNIRQNSGKMIQSPSMIRVDNSRIALAYFGENSMVACCPDVGGVQDNILYLYHQIAPFAVRELDNLSHNKRIRKIGTNFQYYGDQKLYVAFLRFEHYEKAEHIFGKKYVLYESNSYQKYNIYLIPEEENKFFSVYDIYNRMAEESKPELFIFSQAKYCQNELVQEIARIKNLLSSLLFLKGCFSMDELPMLYLLANTPQENDILLYSSKQRTIKVLEEVKPFLHTLRIYLVLHSIKDVSHLMGIHVNSVKYRMEKALQYLGMDDTLPVSELSSLYLLMYLEHLELENR